MKPLGCRTVKIMAIPYEKDKALCSPTSALEKKQMASKESFLMKNIYSG
jgi:hypothetical protein